MYTHMYGAIALAFGLVCGCGGMDSERFASASDRTQSASEALGNPVTVNPYAPGRMNWLMINDQITAVADAGTEGAAMAAAYFNSAVDGGTTYDVDLKTTAYPNEKQALDFKGYSGDGGMHESLAKCSDISTNVKAIVLDIESWQDTPATESANPVAAYESAYNALQNFNTDCNRRISLIATPGTDLAYTVPKGSCASELAVDQFHGYVCLNLASRIAPFCDQYEIQAQAAQNTPSEFQWFVEQSQEQVTEANHKATLMAGIAADPYRLPGCDPATLFTDVTKTFHMVDGYWLNVLETPGYTCPGNEAVGKLAADFLHQLYTN